ncbi:metallophosphoesterase [Rheinheimera sp. 1928-s]|uniref:metallophosphoesterase n=1 Tax=Rheinheimera sp. 1928-s TaxID=3033803 RepID=UPI0026140EB7|nr:metallophosphoesterase [Rheinheimera sp. 1928-s]MDF3126021.1 metallophosphoesterase [Rheinheimera sp. 1928-s]
MSLILTNLKHFTVTFLLLLVTLVCFGLFIGADAHLFEDKLAYQLDGEVHVFYQDNQTVALRIKGDNDSGFTIERQALSTMGDHRIEVRFPEDKSSFTAKISEEIQTPDAIYTDGEPIVALSDIESGFGAFRQFLVSHGIADNQLNWTFGKGHLVLVGDFVDRGASTTQVLWGIYKLEQSARQSGGQVHFVIGNHEIKNLQGNFQSANEKYFYIAGILGKQQFQLFDDNALLGRWLASKNVLEIINGVAFVHGGLHPDIAKYQPSVDEINQIVRSGYRTLYYTPATVTKESFLQSSTTGPAWYRGYFKDDLSQAEVEQGLKAVNANAVVVGHTLQGEVKALYNRKVFAIDVRHPKDYLSSFPFRNSEGLLIKDGQYFRLSEDGSSEAL